MNLKKVIQRRIRYQGGGVNAAGDVNAVVSANVGEDSSQTHVSTRSRQRIVQRSGRTQVTHDTRQEEKTMKIRPEEAGTDTEPDGTPAEELAESPELRTPPIDEDVAGSVNAALPDADDE